MRIFPRSEFRPKKGLVVNKNTVTPGSIAAILLAASLGSPVFAQNTPAASSAPQTSAPQTSATSTSTSGAATDTSTYATGQPLPEKSNEGFWGKVNPLARKKWVNRQVAPVKDRLNELDQLTAKNANDIKDVDSRAQAGIHQAQSTADAANQQAQQASTQAGQAQQMAQQANTQTAQLNTTVTNLDQYQQITDTELHFRSSQVALNAKAKEALDQVATQLEGQKGYIVEVQGYSQARGQVGIQKSQIWQTRSYATYRRSPYPGIQNLSPSDGQCSSRGNHRIRQQRHGCSRNADAQQSCGFELANKSK